MSKASREVANLTWKKNPHTPVDGVKVFVCLSICSKIWPQLSQLTQNRKVLSSNPAWIRWDLILRLNHIDTYVVTINKWKLFKLYSQSTNIMSMLKICKSLPPCSTVCDCTRRGIFIIIFIFCRKHGTTVIR